MRLKRTAQFFHISSKLLTVKSDKGEIYPGGQIYSLKK